MPLLALVLCGHVDRDEVGDRRQQIPRRTLLRSVERWSRRLTDERLVIDRPLIDLLDPFGTERCARFEDLRLEARKPARLLLDRLTRKARRAREERSESDRRRTLHLRTPGT